MTLKEYKENFCAECGLCYGDDDCPDLLIINETWKSAIESVTKTSDAYDGRKDF